MSELSRRAPTSAMVLLVLWLAGCQLAALFENYNVAARHTLDDTKKTLVLVEDHPTRGFGAASANPAIAARVQHELRENEAVQSFVALSELNDLAAREGEAFDRMSIYEIGRRLGAQQVIYIYVDAIDQQQSGTMVRPTAHVRVKVVDVAEQKREFPTKEHAPDPDRGYPLEVTMFYSMQDQLTRTRMAELTRRLAERVGVESARLFFNYRRRTVGEPREDE